MKFSFQIENLNFRIMPMYGFATFRTDEYGTGRKFSTHVIVSRVQSLKKDGPTFQNEKWKNVEFLVFIHGYPLPG